MTGLRRFNCAGVFAEEVAAASLKENILSQNSRGKISFNQNEFRSGAVYGLNNAVSGNERCADNKLPGQGAAHHGQREQC